MKYKQKYVHKKMIGGENISQKFLIENNIQPYRFFHKKIETIDELSIITIEMNKFIGNIKLKLYFTLLKDIYNILYYKNTENKWSVKPFISNEEYNEFFVLLVKFVNNIKNNSEINAANNKLKKKMKEKVDDGGWNIAKMIIDHFRYKNLTNIPNDYKSRMKICNFPMRFRTFCWHISSNEFEIINKYKNIIKGQNSLGWKPIFNLSTDEHFYNISNDIYNSLRPEIQKFYDKKDQISLFNKKITYWVYDHKNDGTCQFDTDPQSLGKYKVDDKLYYFESDDYNDDYNYGYEIIDNNNSYGYGNGDSGLSINSSSISMGF